MKSPPPPPLAASRRSRSLQPPASSSSSTVANNKAAAAAAGVGVGSSKPLRVRIAIVGAEGVGKSCIIKVRSMVDTFDNVERRSREPPKWRKFGKLYRVDHHVSDLGWVDLDLGSSPGWWAAIVASYCPSRVVEHIKSKSNQPRSET